MNAETPSRQDLVYQAALRYYIQGETMDIIAADLGLSRSSVSRLLQEARETGLVRISIAEHRGSASPDAQALGQRFGVRVHLVNVKDNASDELRLERVAKMAGKLITESVADHQVIGIAWGRTVAEVMQYVVPRPLVGARVVQLNGVANPKTFGISYVGAILKAFADAFEAEAVYFPVPTFVDRKEAKEILWDERAVRNVLDLRSAVDLAVFGVGSLDARLPSHVYSSGHLDDDVISSLATDGVVGDVCTVLLREDGSFADIALNQRATGPTPEELRLLPRRICVVADPARAAAVIAALRAGVATDLVLDDATARAVLDRLAADGRGLSRDRAASRRPARPSSPGGAARATGAARPDPGRG